MSLQFFLFDYSLEAADSAVESRRFSPSPDRRSLCRPHTRATSDEGEAGEEQRTHRRRAQGGGQGGGAGGARPCWPAAAAGTLLRVRAVGHRLAGGVELRQDSTARKPWTDLPLPLRRPAENGVRMQVNRAPATFNADRAHERWLCWCLRAPVDSRKRWAALDSRRRAVFNPASRRGSLPACAPDLLLPPRPRPFTRPFGC
jgi:hypothetical protein